MCVYVCMQRGLPMQDCCWAHAHARTRTRLKVYPRMHARTHSHTHRADQLLLEVSERAPVVLPLCRRTGAHAHAHARSARTRARVQTRNQPEWGPCSYGLYSYRLCSFGLCSHGRHRTGPSGYGLYSYGRHGTSPSGDHGVMAYIVRTYVVMAYI